MRLHVEQKINVIPEQTIVMNWRLDEVSIEIPFFIAIRLWYLLVAVCRVL